MKLYLVRHGESEANVAGCINDDPARPVNLTERGRRQAREAVAGLMGVAFTRAYSSRFPRARQTAEILLAGLGLDLPLIQDARLDERHSGLDGQPVEVFNGLVRPDPVHARPEKGESFLEQMQRVRAFLDQLRAEDPAATVLVVSHENPILAVSALAGRDPESAARGGIGNCECFCLDWNG
ncbi:MAG: putative phosphoglycerate mutase [bacterium]|nr:MAG: putative phosphoglycerate mutase [bacterium]KAF0149269.1 MAG: putative phosphoglycerate mutase [bacterium]KAF0169791.1 MAG: putative phosphoglycerate mutase [bacterium]TXT22715.1 MAG: putative phosphoglycerate mutase [bacterium]